MTVESVARKLQPLMPQQVQHWMRARDTADPELKALIEKQIISMAYRYLGDFHNKILLSLPPEKKAKGSIDLGTVVYDKERWPFGISYSELIQNTAILGRSGAGKTNVAFHILQQLIARDIPFIFLDWKRTVRHLIPLLKGKIDIYTPGRSLLKFPFNPFVVPPGVESHVYINQVVDVMSEAFTLGDGSRSVLRKAIVGLYEKGNLCPTVKEIISEVEKLPGKDRMGGWKISAMRALESMEFSDMTAGDRVSQEQLTSDLLHSNTVIELDALGQECKKFLVPLLCQWLYHVRLESADREKLKLVIFIEEAHHVLHKRDHRAKESILEMLFRQCRELGIGIIVLDQHPHLLSAAALGNTYTTICLNQKDPSDINKAAALSLVDSDEKKYFSMLPVGQGIVKLQDRWTRPFLVQFPLVDVKKGSVTDDLLARYSAMNRRNTPRSGRNTFVLPWAERSLGRVPRVPLLDNALDKASFAFLEDVLSSPDDGIRRRYARLGLSVGTGNRLKERLLSDGWLDDQVVELGRTRKLLLRLTKQGKQALGVNAEYPGRESLVHEYWKRFYAERFREQGYKVRLEAPRRSGNVDVLAVKDGRSIAVEVETGKSNIVRNVKQDLLSGFNKVLIIATDEKALAKVEQQLAGAGLLGLERLEIVLRNEG